VRALAAEGARFEDRRRHVLLAGDVDWWIAVLKQAAEVEVGDDAFLETLVATAGDRVCLERVLWTGGPATGRVEIEYLSLVEVDEGGRLVAYVMFDVEDSPAATRECWSRWLARDTAAAPVLAPLVDVAEAYGERDRARLRAAYADDLVVDDQRLAGLGRLGGADAYLDAVAALWELAPDIQLELRCVLALERHGAVFAVRTFGTLADGGGAFERCELQVVMVARGRITRIASFELDAAGAAVARLAELRADPLRIPPNAASRANNRHGEAWQARDWAALRALASPDFVWEDRSKRALLSGDVEMWIESNQFLQGASFENERIGTAGDRIVLNRSSMKSAPDGSPVEREHLRLTEVDADGRIRAVIRFDPDDRAAAFGEASARFVAGEAAAIGGQAPIAALYRSVTRHDWDAVRSCLAADAVMWDRRALGILGTLGRDEWVESLRAAAELAPDMNVELVWTLAWNARGRVSLARMVGTRDGGPFENTFVGVVLVDGDRIQRNELFDVADADRALARFEELCAGMRP
jgi:ketosteroid isomerase-like protein